jgi:hypothetical protein
MKALTTFIAAAAALLIAGCVAPRRDVVTRAPALAMLRPLNVTATNVAPMIVTSGPANTNTLMELRAGSATKFAVWSNGIPTILQRGTVITTADGSVTNTFQFPYSTNLPAVVNTQLGLNTTTTNTLVVTPTNFVLRTSLAGQTNAWMALGELR